jgi:hypothetical protein
MTDDHLTDEQLSSHLDGFPGVDLDETVSASASFGAHLAGCSPCRERLAALESVRARLMQAPVPPVAPDVRAASIESVLRRAGEGRPDAVPPSPSDVHKQNPDLIRIPSPIPMPRRRPQVLVGAAAAVLVLAAAVGVPLALLGQGSSDSVQSRASATAGPSVRRPAPADHSARASGTYGLSKGATATVYALGPLSSVDGLRSRVAALSSQEFSAAAPEPQSAANATAPTASGTSKTSAVSGATPIQFERCLASAVHTAGSTTIVRLLATATYKTTPALVYVFEPAPSGSATENAGRSAVVVTARQGCRVLATTRL